MKQQARLGELTRITELAFSTQQGRVARLQAQFDALGQQLAVLDQQRKARADAPGTTPDAAFCVGADMTWLKWVERRKTAINLERAQIAARIEHEKGALRLAFGRHQAARALHAKCSSITRQKL